MNNCNQEQQNSVSKIHQETNTRIYDRNIPSQILQPYLDVRPVMTKYSYFPVVDPRKNITTTLNVQPTFSPHTVFNPGNTQSPWSGFASKITLDFLFSSSRLIGKDSSPTLIKYSPSLLIEITKGSFCTDIFVVSVFGKFTSIP